MPKQPEKEKFIVIFFPAPQARDTGDGNKSTCHRPIGALSLQTSSAETLWGPRGCRGCSQSPQQGHSLHIRETPNLTVTHRLIQTAAPPTKPLCGGRKCWGHRSHYKHGELVQGEARDQQGGPLLGGARVRSPIRARGACGHSTALAPSVKDVTLRLQSELPN